MSTCPFCAEDIPATGSTCPHCGRGLAGRDLLNAATQSGGAAAPITAVPSSAVLLIVGALIATAVGFISLAQATMGVGILCVGCVLVMCARIAQAGQHHREVIQRLAGTAKR